MFLLLLSTDIIKYVSTKSKYLSKYVSVTVLDDTVLHTIKI